MASLIPAIGTCLPRMTSGERRLAERLEQKLDDDYLLWYVVPVGPKMEEMVLRVIHGVNRKHIPSGQYQAVLIDEGHDFQPQWLRLWTQIDGQNRRLPGLAPTPSHKDQ